MSDESHIHYDFRDLRPAESRPATHVPEPISHSTWEHAETIEQLILECIELFQTARHPRTDATWPRLRARLRHYRALLSGLLDEPEGDISYETVNTYLRYIDHYFGPTPTKEGTDEPS